VVANPAKRINKKHISNGQEKEGKESEEEHEEESEEEPQEISFLPPSTTFACDVIRYFAELSA
jgi:hypothetical protein